MWISNTATAAMMLPIANAVLTEMNEERTNSKRDPNGVTSSASTELSTNPAEDTDAQSEGTGDSAEQNVMQETDFGGQEQLANNEVDSSSRHTEKMAMDGSLKNLAKVLMLGVAYSANIGGTATLTGTGPNLVLRGDISKLASKRLCVHAFVYNFVQSGLLVTLFWCLLLPVCFPTAQE